ncbi:MAG: HNH endonuclease, partial [Chloroflexota bacterium]|nr:HNH endonuclease [Chloroflexota bacterium]
MPFKDIDERRAYGREWMRRNAEKAREAMRRWRTKHPDEHAAQSRERYARDPAKITRIIESSPNRAAVRRAMHNRRRDRVRGTAAFTAAEWRALVVEYTGQCAYCGGTGPLHADHRVPLSRGGASTIDNILPACARCNLRKHTLTEAEFRGRLAS